MQSKTEDSQADCDAQAAEHFAESDRERRRMVIGWLKIILRDKLLCLQIIECIFIHMEHDYLLHTTEGGDHV